MKLAFITDEEWTLLERNHSCPQPGPISKKHLAALLEIIEDHMAGWDLNGATYATEHEIIVTDIHANILLCDGDK